MVTVSAPAVDDVGVQQAVDDHLAGRAVELQDVELPASPGLQEQPDEPEPEPV
jgi:hypothetical protein